VFKRPATPVRGGRQDEKYAGKIERHQDSKRDLRQQSNQSTRQRAQPSTRQQNRQSTRQRTQPSTRQQNRQSTRQRTQPSTRQQNRQSTRKRVQPSTREQNNRKRHRLQDQEINKRKGSPKKTKPECLEDDRQGPQSATIQINRQTRQSARETRRLSVLKDEKMINKRDKDLLIFTYQQTLVYRYFKT
jgi:hypothetical protein